MLHLLEIENYAVIEKLRVGFHPGLNLLTGETGSGKSILVDAFSLLLGARASPELIRAGAERARVAGVFEIARTPPAAERIARAGLELEQDELLIEREVLANGKSRASVNGHLAPLSALRQIAPLLGDLHGQHEQQDLFSLSTQLEMLDRFCATLPEERAGDSMTARRERLAEVFAAWQQTGGRLETLRRSEQEKNRLLDLWTFQRREIAEANLRPGQDQRLEEEKRVLANLARIQQGGNAAYEALYESPTSAAASLKSAARAIEDLSRFDAAFGAWAQALEQARINAEEAALGLRQYLDRLEADPGRLGEIEDRLALVQRLKRKYGSSIEEILGFLGQLEAQIAELELSQESIERLEREQQALAEEYGRLAQALSRRRRQAAGLLVKPVEKELAALAMEQTRFRIDFEEVAAGPASWTAQGIDRVRFQVSPNPGEPPRPLEMVASGGELSRITLALKTCLTPEQAAGGGPPPTLVFDEIDAGIGGRAADAVGRRLRRLSRSYQILCVTHLPQIAGFADGHYSVDKQVRSGRTLTTVSELGPQQRIEELARMLSGKQVTEEALSQARRLVEAALSEPRA